MSATTPLPSSLDDIVFHILDPLEAAERDVFLTRVEAWYPDLLDGLTTLYGEVAEEEALNLLALAAQAYVEREHELRRLDLVRTLDPSWAQHPGRIGYAAYTERFAGTLRGVEDRIDYLRELGVTYLHLMPLLTPRPGDSDGGYAVADYRSVRPDLGTMEDLEHLAGELRAEGISLVVDLVLNHVAAEHEWAVRARAGEQRYRDYFLIFPDRTEPDVYERTIVCYSYSKSLSLPGERIGWVLVPASNPDQKEVYAACAGAARTLGFVCAPALFQHVIIDCVDEPADVEAYAKNREVLTEGLTKLGYEYIQPDGAFYLWVRAPGGDAQAFCDVAKQFELLPVPSDSFGCPGWLRVSYCVAYQTCVDSLTAWEKTLAAMK